MLDDTRAAAREIMALNLQDGVHPRTVALDLVGRKNKLTGRREGGIIGLHSSDVRAKQRALEELRSDPTSSAGRAALRNYLGRETRDKRFDGSVRRAIREGKRIPAEKARKMLLGMESKMLRNRGRTIARTEMIGSLHAAQDEAMQQMLDNGYLKRDQVSYEWDASEDSATRDSHRAMDGQIRKEGDPFVTGAGHLLRFPGDRGLGAPAEEIINCRCQRLVKVDYLAELENDPV